MQRFDTLVGKALADLERCGELDNTIVVITGDHGMPFPRAKSNLYDIGTRVPLAIRWPGGGVPDGREVEDFVSLTDLAPTFMQVAGLDPPSDATGRSLLPLLQSDRSGRVDPARDFVVVGKERHVPSQEAPDMGGYPSRGLRTHEYFYIRNYRPDRWPDGTPNFKQAAIPGAWYADTDNGPTKTYIIANRDKDDAHRKLYELSFAKRPAEELYDLSRDPDQLHNVAADPAYAEVKRDLAARLLVVLQETGDPRVVGGLDFDEFEYLGSAPKHPDWDEEAIEP